MARAPRTTKTKAPPKAARQFEVGTLPSREAILEAMAQFPNLDGKRELARHFGIKGDMRTPFKVLLKEMEGDGHLARSPTISTPSRRSGMTPKACRRASA
jgi:ribonuclease R